LPDQAIEAFTRVAELALAELRTRETEKQLRIVARKDRSVRRDMPRSRREFAVSLSSSA